MQKMQFKQTKIRFLVVICFSLFLLVGFSNRAFANETEGIGYQVEPIFSKEQIDPDKGFYYLKTVPGSEQIIEAEILSTQEAPVDIKISILDGYTQDNGQMGYTETKKLDETLSEPISSLVTIEPEIVTVEKFEKKKVQIKLKLPKESYTGVKAGALLFSKEDKDVKGISSKNEFRIGLLISENGDSYSDSHTLNLIAAKGTIKEAKKVVSLTFQNPEPKILADLMMNVSIKEKKSGKVIKTRKATEYMMAPNSRFEFDLDWGIEKIPTGDFIAEVEATNGQDNWSLKKEFTISGKVAKELNDNSPYQIITPLWVKISSVFLGISLIIVSSILLIRKKRRKKQVKLLKRGKSKKRRK